MRIMDIFWLFFMLTAIQPLIRRKVVEIERKRLLRIIEHSRNSRAILLIHRQETMSLLGFPLIRYIDIHDSEEVLRAIHMTDPDVPIDLVLHTPGGLVLAATQIAHAICSHKARVTVFVPHYAMSGGTLIALAADEIVMSPHAVLGPVDPQLGQQPAASILKAVRDKPIERIDDQTLILADQAEKAVRQVRQTVRRLIGDKIAADKANELADILSTGKWTHDHPITFEQAKELGLPVRDDIPEIVLRLLELYPQPVRSQPTVEYIPVPRRSGKNVSA